MKVEKINNKLHVSDVNKGIEISVSSGKYIGSGSRKYKSDIDKAISEYITSDTEEILNKAKEIYNNTDDDYKELASLSFMVDNLSSNVRTNVANLEQIQLWQNNPIKYANELRKHSIYLMGENGIVARTLDLFSNLHGMTSNLSYTNAKDENLAEDLSLIRSYDSYINKPTILRYILKDVVHGTAMGYIYRKRWVQMLDMELYTPARLVNGNWQIKCDLMGLISGDANKTMYEYTNNTYLENYTPNLEVLSRQPDEIRTAFEKWKDGGKRYYYIPTDRTIVIKLGDMQQERYGRPYIMPAMNSIYHKYLIQQAEEVLIDKVLHSVLTLTMGEKGKEQDGNFKPTPEQRKQVGTAVKGILNKTSGANNKDGFKLIGLPWWAQLEEISTDLSLFGTNKYEEIDQDIRVALGVGEIFGSKESGSFASATISLDIFFRNIFSVLEQIEEQLFNRQYQLMTKNRDNIFTRKFSRGTTFTSKEKVEILTKIFNIGGAIKPLLDEIGIDFDEYVSQVKHEKENGLHELFEPYRTSFNSGEEKGDSGRPSETDGINDNGNETPSPTD